MGPRFFKRGDDNILKFVDVEVDASMGPRFFKRGDLRGPWATGCTSGRLQWGHASLSVETAAASPLTHAVAMLQWGHASLSVETAVELI